VAGAVVDDDGLQLVEQVTVEHRVGRDRRGEPRVPCVDGRGDGLLARDQLLELGQVGRAERDIGTRATGNAGRPIQLSVLVRVD